MNAIKAQCCNGWICVCNFGGSWNRRKGTLMVPDITGKANYVQAASQLSHETEYHKPEFQRTL